MNNNVQVQVNNQNAKANFDPSVPRQKYDPDQWKLKQAWYDKEVKQIFIPDGPTTADVQHCALAIDRILTTARLDYAYVTQSYSKYDFIIKIEKDKAFNTVQQQNSGTKLTVDSIKSLVATYMSTTKYENTNKTLYEIFLELSSRKTFMDGVIKILEDKKDLLINHLGLLKIENTLSSSSMGK